MKKLALVAMALVLLLPGFAYADRHRPMEFLGTFTAAWNAKDADKVSSLFTDDGELTLADDRSAKGKEPIKALLKKEFAAERQGLKHAAGDIKERTSGSFVELKGPVTLNDKKQHLLMIATKGPLPASTGHTEGYSIFTLRLTPRTK